MSSRWPRGGAAEVGRMRGPAMGKEWDGLGWNKEGHTSGLGFHGCECDL